MSGHVREVENQPGPWRWTCGQPDEAWHYTVDDCGWGQTREEAEALLSAHEKEWHTHGVEMWCSLCLAHGEQHINQEDRSVHKHSHVDDRPCTRPWSALCQTEHGDLCHTSDHTSQPAALTALLKHLERGKHIAPGAGDRETLTPCARPPVQP